MPLEKKIHILRACVLSCFSCVLLLGPYGPEPARLPCSWDSPGKNTGVGYHVLLPGGEEDLPDPRTEPTSFALAGGFFTDSPPGKPPHVY